MTRGLRIILPPFLILSFLSASPRRVTAQAAGDVYSDSAFVPAAKSLPPHFAGNDIRLTWATLNTWMAPRGKTEQPADYLKRVHGAAAGAGFGDMNAGSLFSFVCDLTSDDDAPVADYDAGSHRLVITYSPDDPEIDAGSDTNRDQAAFDLHVSEALKLGAYDTMDRYGDSFTVTQESVQNWKVLVNNALCFPHETPSGNWIGPFNLRFSLPMTQEQAQVALPHLRLLVYGHLAAPYVLDTQSQYVPSLEQPVAAAVVTHLVCLKPQGLWIFDSVTGQVWYRLSVSR